jgi:formylglycine-generating enzyme required for sulfatase activity
LAAAIIPILAGGVVLTLKLLQLQPDHTRYPNEQQKPVRVTNTEPLPATFKNSIGMEFVIVPKGRSWLGGFNGIPGDKEVEIRDDFYLGKYVVTQEEWTQMMGENPSHFSRKGGGMDAVKDINDADLKRFPVENVSWDQCQTFVAKLNELEKETGWVYRLPKEVEWEYACRGGPMSDKLDSAFDFYFAKPTNIVLPERANFEHGNGLKRPCKVGSYQPNVLGLYDMHGNVWEYFEDPELIGGGSWLDESYFCRAAHRSPTLTNRYSNLGFRMARIPSSAPSPEAKTLKKE